MRTRARPHREVKKKEENNTSGPVADRSRWPVEVEGAPGGGAEQRRAVWMCGGCGAQRRSDSKRRERFSGEIWGVFLEEGGVVVVVGGMRKDAGISFFLAGNENCLVQKDLKQTNIEMKINQ